MHELNSMGSTCSQKLKLKRELTAPPGQIALGINTDVKNVGQTINVGAKLQNKNPFYFSSAPCRRIFFIQTGVASGASLKNEICQQREEAENHPPRHRVLVSPLPISPLILCIITTGYEIAGGGEGRDTTDITPFAFITPD